MLYTAMESFKEGYHLYQRALRVKPFPSLEAAIQYAKRRAKGKPFVCQGVKIIWLSEA